MMKYDVKLKDVELGTPFCVGDFHLPDTVKDEIFKIIHAAMKDSKDVWMYSVEVSVQEWFHANRTKEAPRGH